MVYQMNRQKRISSNWDPWRSGVWGRGPVAPLLIRRRRVETVWCLRNMTNTIRLRRRRRRRLGCRRPEPRHPAAQSHPTRVSQVDHIAATHVVAHSTCTHNMHGYLMSNVTSLICSVCIFTSMFVRCSILFYFFTAYL